MINGIVAFELTVTDLQAKFKLSQNRSEMERHNIIDDLVNSTGSNDQEITAYMRHSKN